jgi:hypothetical protein
MERCVNAILTVINACGDRRLGEGGGVERGKMGTRNAESARRAIIPAATRIVEGNWPDRRGK